MSNQNIEDFLKENNIERTDVEFLDDEEIKKLANDLKVRIELRKIRKELRSVDRPVQLVVSNAEKTEISVGNSKSKYERKTYDILSIRCIYLESIRFERQKQHIKSRCSFFANESKFYGNSNKGRDFKYFRSGENISQIEVRTEEGQICHIRITTNIGRVFEEGSAKFADFVHIIRDIETIEISGTHYYGCESIDFKNAILIDSGKIEQPVYTGGNLNEELSYKMHYEDRNMDVTENYFLHFRISNEKLWEFVEINEDDYSRKRNEKVWEGEVLEVKSDERKIVLKCTSVKEYVGKFGGRGERKLVKEEIKETDFLMETKISQVEIVIPEELGKKRVKTLRSNL